jgi:uncharacterized membrane protein YkvA (DUF1232 family)
MTRQQNIIPKSPGRGPAAPVKPEEFARYRTRASMLVRSPDELKALIGRAARKLAAAPEKFSAARGQLNSFLGLLKAYVKGDYRDVSAGSLIAIVAAVLYFVVPLDLIPDFLLGLGLLDDAVVIGYVFSIVGAELSNFEDWLAAQQSVAPKPVAQKDRTSP